MAERVGETGCYEYPMDGWERPSNAVRVTTLEGSEEAHQVGITAGPWMAKLVPSLASQLFVERNVLFWFEPRAERDAFARLPVYIVEDTDRIYYGFPYIEGQGVKVAGLHFGDPADPDMLDRTPSPDDQERVRGWLRRRVPLANGERRDAKVCMYTDTVDPHFVIDNVLEDSNVVVASACSGHGFKFANVVS